MAKYYCKSCNAQAHKDPVTLKDSGLHKWHCDRCGVVKVTRRNDKEKSQ